MSYQERRALVNLATTVIVTAAYWSYILQRYPEVDAYSPEIFRFWGSNLLILIPVSIVSKIIIAIVFVIINTIATQEVEPSITDERDRLIELKSTRNSFYIFILGFLLAMAALAAGQPPAVMFIILFGAGFVSEMFGEISEFLYYRRGV